MKYVGQTINDFKIYDVISIKRNKKCYNYYFKVICIKCNKEQIKDKNCVLKGIAKCNCQSKHNANNLSKTKLYKIYSSMIERTTRKNNKSFKNYGGRGITVCDEWLKDFTKFYEWSMSNGYNEGLSIDRIDVNDKYSPNNCRWITMKEQASNKRNNHYVSYNGKTQTLSQWAREYKINYHTLFTRISRGWNFERAIGFNDEYLGGEKNGN